MASAGRWLDPRAWGGFPTGVNLNLQRRLVSYLLKRTAGPFLRDDERSLEAQAELLEKDALGTITLADLVIDEAAVNARLSSAQMPVVVRSATVGRVVIRFTWPSATWTDRIRDPWTTIPKVKVEVERLRLDLVIINGMAQQCSTDVADSDLAQSVLHVAEDFVHDQLSMSEMTEMATEVEDSGACSVLSDSSPAFPGGLPGHGDGDYTGAGSRTSDQSTSLLAGMVARILASLEVAISHSDASFSSGDLFCSVKIPHFSSRPRELPQPEQDSSLARGFCITSPRVDLAYTPRSQRSPTSSSSEDSGLESAQEMYLSQAVADLRHSISTFAPPVATPKMADRSTSNDFGSKAPIEPSLKASEARQMEVQVASLFFGPGDIDLCLYLPASALYEPQYRIGRLSMCLPAVHCGVDLHHIERLRNLLAVPTATKPRDPSPDEIPNLRYASMSCPSFTFACMYGGCGRREWDDFFATGSLPVAAIGLMCGPISCTRSDNRGSSSVVFDRLEICKPAILERTSADATFTWLAVSGREAGDSSSARAEAVDRQQRDLADLVVQIVDDGSIDIACPHLTVRADLTSPGRFCGPLQDIAELLGKTKPTTTRLDSAKPAPRSRHRLTCPALQLLVEYSATNPPDINKSRDIVGLDISEVEVTSSPASEEVAVAVVSAWTWESGAESSNIFFICRPSETGATRLTVTKFKGPKFDSARNARFIEAPRSDAPLIRIGQVAVDLSKPQFDQLHYAADALSRCLAKWSTSLQQPEDQPMDGAPPPPSRPLARQSLGLVALVRIRIHQATLSIQFPSPSVVAKLILRLERINVQQVVPDGGGDVAGLDVQVRTVLLHGSNRSPESDIHSSTQSLVQRREGVQGPMLRLKTRNSSSPRKQTRVSIRVSAAILRFGPDQTWPMHLSDFLKAPPGVFEDVQPNDLTRIRVLLHEVAMHAWGTEDGHCAILQVPRVAIHARPPQGVAPANTRVQGSIHLFVADAASKACRSEPITDAGAEKDGELVQVASMTDFAFTLCAPGAGTTPERSTKAELNGGCLSISLCADTLAGLATVADNFRSASASPSDDEPDISEPAQRSSLAHSISMGSTLLDIPSVTARCSDSATEGHHVPSRHRTATSNKPLREMSAPQVRPPSGLKITESFLLRTTPKHKQITSRPSAVTVAMEDCTLSIRLHDGFDWSSTRQTIENERRKMRKRLQKIRQLLAEGQPADSALQDASATLFNSVHIGLPSPHLTELSHAELMEAIDDELVGVDDSYGSDSSEWQSLPLHAAPKHAPFSGTSGEQSVSSRSRSPALEIILQGVSGRWTQAKIGEADVSSVVLKAEELAILDHIRTSTWRKFLTELRSSEGGLVRPTETPMLKVFFSNIIPSPSSRSEITLKVKLSPIRLYVDQDAVTFLKAFGAFKAEASGDPTLDTAAAQQSGVFFRRVEILPIRLKLDYKPKHVDFEALRRGKAVELMNFFHFEGSNMTLRHAVLTGVDGPDRMSDLLQDIWTPDIKANQLSDVISGIAPVRSVVNVGTGVADLVLLPIEQVRKDGRLARGVQKGATSFARSTALEAVKLGARLATGTQVILEKAETVLGAKLVSDVRGETVAPLPSMGQLDQQEAISRYADQPTGMQDGLRTAYQSFGESMRTTAQTILAVPLEVFNEGSGRAVLKAVPIALIHPMAGATGAISKTLLGLRHSLDPHASTADEDKYKRTTGPSV